MKDSFNDASRGEPPAARESSRHWDEGIVTRAERDQLEQARARPFPALTLEQHTPRAKAVDRAVEQFREMRIRHIDRRLGVAREGFERNVDDSFGW